MQVESTFSQRLGGEKMSSGRKKKQKKQRIICIMGKQNTDESPCVGSFALT